MYIDIFCRATLALVFAAAAVGKGRSRSGFAEFRSVLRSLGVRRLDAPLAAGVIAAEAGTAAALVAAPTVAGGYLGSALLLAGFCAAITVAMRRRAAVACRCFGGNGAPLGRTHLLRNGALLAVTAAGAGGHVLAGPTAPSLAVGGVLLLGGAAVALLFIRWDDLAYLL